ncbi:hypothetical protein Hanom_Chr09g00828181 [Helianthus anomalus]
MLSTILIVIILFISLTKSIAFRICCGDIAAHTFNSMELHTHEMRHTDKYLRLGIMAHLQWIF